MHKSFATAGLIAAVAAFDQVSFEYMQYLSKFGKSYQTLDEFNMRKDLFIARD